MHRYMEMSQRKLLCSYFKQAKCHLFYKIGEQERGNLAPGGGGRWWGKDVGR
jgi:hypothetical protein